MPFRGKSKKGRPKGSTTTGYTNFSVEEKRQYHGESVQEHRQRLDQIPLASTSETTEPSNEPSSSGKRGGKPVFDAAMTPNTRRKRRCKMQKTRRRQQKTSQTRSKISHALWNKTTDDPTTPGSGEEIVDTNSDTASDEDGSSDDVADDIHADSPVEEHATSSISRATEWRYKSKLRGCLPSNNVDCLNMLICFLNSTELPPTLSCQLKDEITKLPPLHGTLNQRQLRYRVRKFISQININEEVLTLLMEYWLGLLFEHRYLEVLFCESEINIDNKYLPKSFVVSREASRVAKELVTSRRNVSDGTKKAGIDYVVNVAKRCGLRSDVFNDTTILSNATSCHHYFAKKVLEAIESGDELTLYRRSMKYNAIKATHWPEHIMRFVLSEGNTRAVPGKEQVCSIQVPSSKIYSSALSKGYCHVIQREESRLSLHSIHHHTRVSAKCGHPNNKGHGKKHLSGTC